jgi:hypothetical protein
MRKNNDRKQAEQAFLNERGRITNKELAEQLNVHPASVARWRRLDEWDAKLLQRLNEPEESEAGEDDPYSVDIRQLRSLNERIEAYLKKQELLPSEILQLAEAKFHIMNCMELIRNEMRYPLIDGFESDEEELF